MSLTPYMFSNLDNFLDNVFQRDFIQNHRSYHSNMQLDVYETEIDIVVKAYVPGLSSDKIDLYVDNNKYLSIQASYDVSNKEEKASYYRYESTYGTVKRTIRLPRNTDISRQKATLKDGVLEIHFGKLSENTGHKIPISAF